MLTAIGLREYNHVVLKEGGRWPGLLWALIGALAPLFLFRYGAAAALPFLFTVTVFFFIVRFASGRELDGALSEVGLRLFGVLYVALLFSHFVLLRGLGDGRWWILFAFAVVWLNDTCAYYGGRSLGRRKLAPKVSPGKTIEGALCGLVGGAISALVFVSVFNMDIGFLAAALLAVVVGVAGILGDLAESLIKRCSGVKDSGTLIPGHGGLLDRADSLLFAVPVIYYFLLCGGGF